MNCELTIRNGKTTADAKNVLDIMALNAVTGTKLDLEARGEGATAGLETIVALFESDFQIDEADES